MRRYVTPGEPIGAWKAPSERTKASGPSGFWFAPASAAGGLHAKGSRVAWESQLSSSSLSSGEPPGA